MKVVIALLLAVSTALAGTIPIGWDASPDQRVTGYKIFAGTSSGNYTTTFATTSTSYDLDWPDCSVAFIAVKATGEGDLESAEFSNEIEGWPTPQVDSLTPSTSGIQVPGTATFVLSGTNLSNPLALAVLRDGERVPGVSTANASVTACREATFDLTAGPATVEGAADLQVLRVVDGVYGVWPGAFVFFQASLEPVSIRRLDEVP